MQMVLCYTRQDEISMGKNYGISKLNSQLESHFVETMNDSITNEIPSPLLNIVRFRIHIYDSGPPTVRTISVFLLFSCRRRRLFITETLAVAVSVG